MIKDETLLNAIELLQTAKHAFFADHDVYAGFTRLDFNKVIAKLGTALESRCGTCEYWVADYLNSLVLGNKNITSEDLQNMKILEIGTCSDMHLENAGCQRYSRYCCVYHKQKQ